LGVKRYFWIVIRHQRLFCLFDFLMHINSLVRRIQFTLESENEQGELAMLDCKIKRTKEELPNSLSRGVKTSN
uniref:Uncharacterized protein n=1 Tax=Trichobilharzia regenti TaxID=157069 RepID=A0AA85J8B8_TRIRE